MAKIETVDAVAVQHGSPGIFTGKRFFVVQRIPDRLLWLDRIRLAGGSVVRLENQADFTIADDERIDCPPNSISWRFIQDTLAKNSLVNPDEYRCQSGTGAARPPSSMLVPPKKTRTNYSAEDDQILLAHLKEIARRGGPIMGNKPYKELEAKLGKHTWQSWRSRYVDTLSHQHTVNDLIGMDEPDLAAVIDEGPRASNTAQPPIHSATLQTEANINDAVKQSNAQDGPDAELESRRCELLALLESRKPVDSSNKIFSTHDILLLVYNLNDIPLITYRSWNSAWDAWTEASQHRHTSQDWKNFYVNHVTAVLNQKRWTHALEDRGSRESATTPIKKQTSPPIKVSPARPLTQGSPVVRSPSSNQELKRKISTPIKQSPSKKQATIQDQASRLEAQSAAQPQRPEIDHDRRDQQSSDARPSANALLDAEPAAAVSGAQREKLEWVFDQALQKKHVEDSSVSIATPISAHAKHRLTAANLATQSRQQSITPSRVDLPARESQTHQSPPQGTQWPVSHMRSSPGDMRLVQSSADQHFPSSQQNHSNQSNRSNHATVPGETALSTSQRDIENRSSQVDPHVSIDVADMRFKSQQPAGVNEASNESGHSFDSALLATAPNLSKEMDGTNAPMPYTFDIDLSVPSPYKPTQAERSARSSGGEGASADASLHDDAEGSLGREDADEDEDEVENEDDEIEQDPQAFTMDTQALVNAKTQVPDLSMPDPDSVHNDLSFSIEHNSNTHDDVRRDHQLHDDSLFVGSQSRTPSPVMTSTQQVDAEPIDGDAIEAFYQEFGSKGYSEEDITTALQMTCARPDLAEFVLILRRQGEPIPSDVPGIWTAEDDEILHGGDGRKIRTLETRHGREEFNTRLEFLKDLNRDSSH